VTYFGERRLANFRTGAATHWKDARHGQRPQRNKPSSAHRKFVKELPCVVNNHECSREKLRQFCHFKGFKDGGTAYLPGDERGFPACKHHHLFVQHQHGEPEFQRRYKLDLKAITLGLARRSPDRRIREAIETVRLLDQLAEQTGRKSA